MGLQAVVADRFWSRVEKTDSCWVWTGSRNHWGYGQIETKRYASPRVVLLAHRVAYELEHGEIPPGHQVHHDCRNTFCVNPAHLRAVTPKAHAQLGANAIKTHCKNGHEFTSENTYYRRDRHARQCRTCKREAWKRWKARAA